jgi:hypothetical protein
MSESLTSLESGLTGLGGGLTGLEGGLCGFKTEEYFSRHCQTKLKQDCCLPGKNFIWINVD